jgi:transposase-like protein
MEDALKSVFGPMFEAMLKGEMANHLGFKSNDQNTHKDTNNRRNGYINKSVKSKSGEVKIKVPRDREASFEPQLIEKRKSNVSGIEDKVINMYARGMSQRDISRTIEKIYGFSISAEMISNITNSVLEEQQRWQERPLESLYSFVFVDCTYVSIKQEIGAKKCAVYVVLAYNMEGRKEILGLWIGETEGKHVWMQIFDELKTRGVKDILFMSSDGVAGMEDGAKAIFPNTIFQRCVVHLIRTSLKYVPSKDYKAFTKDLKTVYGAKTLKSAEAAFERLKQNWSKYPGAVVTWVRNWKYIEQLFHYTSDIRRVKYTTNVIESVNSSLKKVVKKDLLLMMIQL